jgi:hypothetical protein
MEWKMEGQRFGRLEVIKYHSSDSNYNKRWWCRCDCGVEKPVLQDKLKNGQVKSCGCYAKEFRENLIQKSKDERREAGKRSYRVMIERCYNTENRSYHRYGGRGLKVCDRWKTGEENKSGWECFFEDMGPKPKNGSLNRVDKLEDYTPNNCYWADKNDEDTEIYDNGRPKGPPKEPIIFATSKDAWIYRALRHPKRKNLTKEDVEPLLADMCPLLEVEMSYDLYEGSATPPNYATLDRIDPNKGYEANNIQVISRRANTIKNDATLKELQMIVRNLEISRG